MRKRVLENSALDYQVLDSGCCGMAGAFGYEKGERSAAHDNRSAQRNLRRHRMKGRFVGSAPRNVVARPTTIVPHSGTHGIIELARLATAAVAARHDSSGAPDDSGSGNRRRSATA